MGCLGQEAPPAQGGRLLDLSRAIRFARSFSQHAYADAAKLATSCVLLRLVLPAQLGRNRLIAPLCKLRQ
jgi:hypothetical protein